MRNARSIRFARIALALALAACRTGSVAGAAEPVRIEIGKFAFVPAEVTIAPGTTVVWTNHDETPHTVADAAHAFVSPALDTDDHYEHRFDASGDVAYFCTVHPFMTGHIHVRQP